MKLWKLCTWQPSPDGFIDIEDGDGRVAAAVRDAETALFICNAINQQAILKQIAERFKEAKS